jgi:uncharacterized protein YndB with AHSA1/START domain
MQQEIAQTWQFDKSPQEVWEYLTNPDLIELWLMKSNFKPVQGHRFQFTFNAKPESKYKGVVDCEVLEITPFSKLSYSWSGSTNDESRNYKSVVIWTLKPNKNGTELLLNHQGFTVLEDILAHTSGWKSCVAKMETLFKSSVQ